MSQNLVEIRVSASSIEAEQAMKRVATVTQDAMNKLKENMAKIRADFGKGFQVETGTMQSSMDRAKRLFDETRTAAERYESKLNELSNQLRNGAIDQDLFNRGLAKAKQELEQANSATAKHETVVSRAMGAVKGMVGAYLGFQGAGAVLKIASDFEQLRVRMDSVMGSQEKGAQAFDWIKRFAKDTPFEVDQVSQSFMRLKAFGIDPMGGAMQSLADMSAKLGGGQETLQRISLALGQAWAKQKLQGEEILQLVEAGVPVWDLLSKIMGKSTAEIQKMSEKGLIGRDVMKQLIDEMGKSSAGASAAQMGTFAGQMSNLADNFKSMINDVMNGTGVMKVFGSVIQFIGNHIRSLTVLIMTGVAVALVRMAGASKMAWMENLKLAASNIAVATSTGGLRAGVMSAITSLGSLVRAAMAASRALLVAAFSNPFTAIIATIGLVVAAIIELKDVSLSWLGINKTIGQVAEETWTDAKNATNDYWEATKSMFEDLKNSDVWQSIKQSASDAWEEIKQSASDAWDSITSSISSAIDSISSYLPSLSDVWGAVTSSMQSIAGAVGGAITSLLGEQTTSAISSAFSTMANYVRGLISGILSYAQSAIDFVNSVVGYVTGKVSDAKAEREDNLKSDQNDAAGKAMMTGPVTPKVSGGGGGGGGKKSKGGGGGGSKSEKSNMSAYNDDLETQKRAYELSHELRTMNISDEIAYWASKKATVKAGSKDALEIQKKIAELTYQDSKESIKRQMELDEVKRNHDQKVALENIDIALSEAKYKKEQGEISGKELLSIEEALENQRTEILKNGILARIKLLEKDPTKNAVELAKLNNEIEDLEREHQQKINDIQRQSAAESKKRWDGVRSSMESLWDKGIDSMMKGTLTFKNAMKAIYADLGKAFAKMGMDMVKNWMMTKARELLVTRTTEAQKRIAQSMTQKQSQGGIFATLKTFISSKLQELGIFTSAEGTKQTVEQAGNVASAAGTVTAAGTKIAANAVVAGTGAASSQASIPIIGPILAVAAMGAILATVMGMKSKVPSARGGYVIPRGVNPLTQLHEEEMVLPKAQANVINRLAQRSGGGASGGGSNSGDTYHIAPVYNDHTGNLSPENIRRNGRLLADEVMRQTRNFKLKKA